MEVRLWMLCSPNVKMAAPRSMGARLAGRSSSASARSYLVTDLTVLVLSLSYLPVQRIAWSLVTVTVSGFLIDRIQGIGRMRPAGAE